MWIQDILKIFLQIITGEYFKFYTVVPSFSIESGFWSTGSETPEGDTAGATSPMVALITSASGYSTGTIDNPPTEVNTVQVFPEVEFTYTLWYYNIYGPFDDNNDNFLYLNLDPVIKGKNVTVTNAYYIPESLVPVVGSATNPYYTGHGPSFNNPNNWNISDFVRDENNEIIFPFWFEMVNPDRANSDKVANIGGVPNRPLKYFVGYDEYISYLNSEYSNNASGTGGAGSETENLNIATADILNDYCAEKGIGLPGAVVPVSESIQTRRAIKATISGYYTHDELFNNVSAKYVPIGQSDLTTPNISLGGNQVDYSGLLSGIPQGQEVYQLTPDSRQQVSVPIRIYYRRTKQFSVSFELGGGSIFFDSGVVGHTPYNKSFEYSQANFTSRQNYADTAFSGTFLKHTQDYSKNGTFLSDYFNSSEYKDGIRTSSLQQTTTETEETEVASGY